MSFVRRLTEPKWIKVGVFPFDDRNTRFNAYTVMLAAPLPLRVVPERVGTQWKSGEEGGD